MTGAIKVLLVEDDPDLAEIVRLKAEAHAITVDVVGDGPRGLDRAVEGDYSLVILDVSLPRMSGLDICRELRERRPSLPILMLTSQSDESDVVLGLELGADDYVTKPFRPRELVSRMRSLVERYARLGSQAEPVRPKTVFRNDRLVVDLEARAVVLDGKRVECTGLEWDLLSLLLESPGRTFTRDELVDALWGEWSSESEPPLNRLVFRLRAKVEPNPATPVHIVTAIGIGYRWGG